MTIAAAEATGLKERRAARHAVLALLGRWRIRHARLTFATMATILLLPAALYLATAWVHTGFVDGARAPNSSLNLIAPDRPSLDILTREIDAATDAERERIATLALVIDPFPYSMPLQGATIPPDQTFAGSDTAARTQTYEAIARSLHASGCADEAGQIEVGRVSDPAALQQAENALIPMQTGAQALNLTRYFYNMGLLQLCKNDMQQAYNAFHSARQTAEAGAGTTTTENAAGQYRFLSAAGERLAAAKIAVSSDAIVLPDLPKVPAAFGQSLCQAGSYADGCALFIWPPRRTALVQLHAFLLDPTARRENYAQALADARNGFGTLSARNYANVIVAHAKAGDFENIGSLLRQLDRFTVEKDCDALGRIANIGWITGQQSEDAKSFACSPDLPTTDGAQGNDVQRLKVWREVHGYRNALKAGNFQALIARMTATDKAPPDTRAFLEQVRSELLGRLSTRLLARAQVLRKQGASGDSPREALLKLLRSEPFSWSTRMAAAIALEWGSFWSSVWWPLGITILLLFVMRLLWNILAGYGLMFTQRHHLEKARNAA
ncbi:MAG: hypothetical protein V4475_11895 [Pseudomonadota bacterium]